MAVVPATEAAISRAGELIRSGELVAFPTETVYGLGADATNGKAVARVFAAKGRPRFNPLIVHVASLAVCQQLAVLDAHASTLAQRFWPGPLTLVLPKRAGAGLSDLVTAGLDTVAIRIPAHPVAQALLTAANRPIAAPSANRSGHVSPTLARHVETDLGSRVAMILDAGATTHGLESTVVTVTAAEIILLRPGSVTPADLEAATGLLVTRAIDGGETPLSPGQLASHYAPRARVVLNAVRPQPGAALLAFGPAVLEHDAAMINLSPKGDLIEAAANLFAAMRALDATGAATIAVMPIPAHGLGEAINDRLQRAAAAKPA